MDDQPPMRDRGMAEAELEIEPSVSVASARTAWLDDRRQMEAARDWFTPDGRKRRPRIEPLDLMVKPFAAFVRLSGTARWVFRPSLAIRRVDLELVLPGLPRALDGYRILHLTEPQVGFNIFVLPDRDNLHAAGTNFFSLPGIT